MPVPTRITDFSATAASNSPTGGEAVGTSLDDYLRGYQAVVRGDLASKGADIASAATTDLGAVSGLMHDITGTTTITGFGTVAAGVWKIVKFEGALTLTHNATSLILLTGANRTTVAGDVGCYISEGSGNWREVFYMPINTQLTNSGVKFAATQAASSDANTLDDYEEGTWTPVLSFDTAGNLSVAYAASSQVGSYTKVGRQVTAHFIIITSTFTHTTASGNCIVTGLPFAAGTNGNLGYTGALQWQGITKASHTNVVAQVAGGASQIAFLASGSGQSRTNVLAADMPTGGTVLLIGSVAYET